MVRFYVCTLGTAHEAKRNENAMINKSPCIEKISNDIFLKEISNKKSEFFLGAPDMDGLNRQY